MRHLSIASLVLISAATAACSAPADEAESVGSASIAITNVPSDVACIQLTATGSRTVTRSYDVTAGASSVLSLASLPIGTVSFRGDAYPGACATVTSGATPNWVAEPVAAVVSSGGVTPVTLMMRRNGQASVAVDWEDSGLAMQTLSISRAAAGVGSVVSAPSGINCGSDCTEAFSDGTTVTLTALPNAGSTFAGWSGGCTGTGTCTVTMTAATNVTATFTLGTNTLTVTRAGSGVGTVVSTPAGINCGADCAESYSNGTVVTLTAAPAVSSIFTGWSGGGCTGTGTCTVTMTAATNVTATFSLAQYSLTINRVGNGTVTSSPAGINCGSACTALYSAGTMVTLTATPATFGVFNGWSGGGCSGTGTCMVTMNAANSVTATFTP
jgi:hypothetical protein